MIFYNTGRKPLFKRYVGLSVVLHACLILVFWSLVKTQIQVMRTTGVEIAVRTIPGPPRPAIPPRPRPGAGPAPAPQLPSLAPRRKMGRIIEKKFKLDMPKIEPQTALRRTGREDEVQMMKDKRIAKFIRAENVEVIDIERKEVYQPPAPAVPQAQMPAGEYLPPTALANVDVTIQYFDVAFEATKIDLDAVQWGPAVGIKGNSPDGAISNQPATQPVGVREARKKLKIIKPEVPENLGIQEPLVEVIIKVKIAENGFITSAQIERSGGYLELDNLALTAVRQWIYESAPKTEERHVKIKYEFPAR